MYTHQSGFQFIEVIIATGLIAIVLVSLLKITILEHQTVNKLIQKAIALNMRVSQQAIHLVTSQNV